MKKTSYLNCEFEYKLLDETQQVTDLREKLTVLYPTPFADILWWELRDLSLLNKGYYKLFYYEQSILTHIVLFKYTDRTQKKIYIINREFKITITHIENICHILFHEFDKVQQIIFENIFEPNSKQLSKMIFEKTSDDIIILDLPESTENYIKSLGKSTRKRIKLATNHIVRDFSCFQVHFFEKCDILYEQIEKIVSLNRSRMKTKGIISALDDTECNILHQYAFTSDFGFVCVCVIDGKIVGGTINSIVGKHAYMHVIAHDNSYQNYSIGLITLLHATKYLIEDKNINHYHLLCGTQEYKFRHGGINHDLYTFRVFRNTDVHFFCGKTLNAFRINYRKFKQRLKNDKVIYNLYIKLNRMKMSITGV